jgi:hypothetical protein
MRLGHALVFGALLGFVIDLYGDPATIPIGNLVAVEIDARDDSQPCRVQLPVIIRAKTSCTLCGAHSETRHSLLDISVMASSPRLRCHSPTWNQWPHL